MSFELDSIYLVYGLVAASAGLFAEGIYLLCYSGVSYRNHVNRRLRLLRNEPNRENILVQLRRERGLTRSGGYSIAIESFNRLLLQSGLMIGMSRLAARSTSLRTCGLALACAEYTSTMRRLASMASKSASP